MPSLQPGLLTVTIPEEYVYGSQLNLNLIGTDYPIYSFKYVGAVGVLNLWLLVKQHRDIMYWREKSGIKYPQSGSTSAVKNAQRSNVGLESVC